MMRLSLSFGVCLCESMWIYLCVCWGKLFHIKIGKICKCLLERIFFVCVCECRLLCTLCRPLVSVWCLLTPSRRCDHFWCSGRSAATLHRILVCEACSTTCFLLCGAFFFYLKKLCRTRKCQNMCALCVCKSFRSFELTWERARENLFVCRWPKSVKIQIARVGCCWFSCCSLFGEKPPTAYRLWICLWTHSHAIHDETFFSGISVFNGWSCECEHCFCHCCCVKMPVTVSWLHVILYVRFDCVMLSTPSEFLFRINEG